MSDTVWQVKQEDGATRLTISGDISEATDFAPLLEQLAEKVVVVDLGSVQRINSCGVREWIDFVGTLNKNGHRLILERCSPFIVNQLNLISNFVGEGGVVRSVYAPYFCTSCDSEHAELLDLAGNDVQVKETIPCPNCKEEMEFEDVADTYLAFRTSG